MQALAVSRSKALAAFLVYLMSLMPLAPATAQSPQPCVIGSAGCTCTVASPVCIVPTPIFERFPARVELSALIGDSDTAVVTLKNGDAATGNLVFSSFNLSGSGYFFVTGGTAVIGGGGLAPGGSATVLVTFRPLIVGDFGGVLIIGGNFAGSPGSVSIRGVAPPAVAVPAPVAGAGLSSTFCLTGVWLARRRRQARRP